MAQITIELIKELREKTLVGMMDCKKALIEADGNIEKAIELLRKKGADVAAKRAGNATNNGRIESLVNETGTIGAMVQINCETDFSAKTDELVGFAKKITEHVLSHKDATTENINEQKIETTGLTVTQMLEDVISKIAEKITVGNIARFQTESGIINTYVHAGSILGIMVELEVIGKTSQNTPALKDLAKDIGMQIAVTNPISIDSSTLDPVIIEKEKEVFAHQLRANGKPENMIEKIMFGKLKKYYQEVCLVSQAYIKNDKTTIEAHINEVAKANGATVKVKQFKRFGIGR